MKTLVENVLGLAIIAALLSPYLVIIADYIIDAIKELKEKANEEAKEVEVVEEVKVVEVRNEKQEQVLAEIKALCDAKMQEVEEVIATEFANRMDKITAMSNLNVTNLYNQCFKIALKANVRLNTTEYTKYIDAVVDKSMKF